MRSFSQAHEPDGVVCGVYKCSSQFRDLAQKMTTKCSECQIEIKVGEEFNHNSKVLCENCCMDIRMPRNRKTHWQYLKSIKNEYLRPAKKKKSLYR